MDPVVDCVLDKGTQRLHLMDIQLDVQLQP